MSELSTCKHPLKAFTVGINKETGNNINIVTPYNVDHLWKPTPDSEFIRIYDDVKAKTGINYTNSVEIPCGKCIACRLRRSREWADRCMLELPYHKHSYFVTLTYDELHCPYVVQEDNGHMVENLTLNKEDLQKFFKRLRIQYKRRGYDNHLKYYACGEYGSNTSRPHYHAIIFGLELDDLEIVTTSSLGFNYYRSQWLESIWSDKDKRKIGNIVIADVSWDTCAYTARYILKKQLGDTAYIYDELAIQPEFTNMSLKPGIGIDYFNENKDRIYRIDSISIPTPKGARNIKPPKYYDHLMEKEPEDKALLEEIKTVRQSVASLKKKQMLDKTDKDYQDILEIEERLLENRIRSLKRKEI